MDARNRRDKKKIVTPRLRQPIGNTPGTRAEVLCERTPVRQCELEREVRMATEASQKRRAGVRYIIGGQVIFHTGSPDSSGELVNLGQYGMLVRTQVQVPAGTDLRIGLAVEGYPHALQGDARVVGARQDLLAVKFLRELPGIIQLLGWLSRENVPWTGLDTLQSEQVILSLVPAPPEQTSPSAQAERQELEAILPFIEAMG